MKKTHILSLSSILLIITLIAVVTPVARASSLLPADTSGDTIIQPLIGWLVAAAIVVAVVVCGLRSCMGGPPPPPPPPKCWNFQNNIFVDTGVLISDTDGGFKPCTGGTITYTDAGGATQTRQDSCSGSGFVDEWYASGGKIYEDSVGCAFGFNCLTNGSGEGYCG